MDDGGWEMDDGGWKMNKERLLVLKGILINTGYYKWLIASLVLFVLGFFFRFNGLAAFVAASILFTVFDLVGYSHIVVFNSTTLLMSYRVLQTTFQCVLALFVLFVYSLQAAVAFLVFHWFGGDEVLYYRIGRYDLPPLVWEWLYWTPLGLILRRPLSTPLVLVQAAVGLVIAVVVCLM